MPGEDLQKRQKGKELYSIKITSMTCTKIDPVAFLNVTCKLKAVRGKQGVLTLFWIYNNIPKLTGAVQIYYRNNSGRYLLYLVNYSVDYCEVGESNFNLLNVITRIQLKFFQQFNTAVMGGCPGKYNFCVIIHFMVNFISCLFCYRSHTFNGLIIVCT